jgi:hypothetical protein
MTNDKTNISSPKGEYIELDFVCWDIMSLFSSLDLLD